MDFNDYKGEFLEEIRNFAQINETTTEEEFIKKSLELLEGLQEISNPYELPILKEGTKGRILQLDAYGFDETDKSLSLIVSDFQDMQIISKLNNEKITTLSNRMIAFLDEICNGTITNFFDDSDEVLKIADEIKRRINIDVVSGPIDESIEKIKLFILTNAEMSDRVKKINRENFRNIKVDVIPYSIERFYQVALSGMEKESIVINTSEYDLPNGIPCVLAEMTGNTDYDAYLAIVPGKFLSDVYYDHGSRLLEGNVRAFLSTRGNINKNIRRTILEEPEKFFTYNNGIATTAKKIGLTQNEKGTFITQMEDLQIINGGQTTASLTSAAVKDKSQLKDIFIPMKLTVVKNDQYDEMISNIAKYANSQNKVTAADMFSNHRFHVAFENMAERYPAPPTNNFVHPTFWFYERSRGKYEQKQFKLITKAEKDKFQRKYPKSQVIKKEELAKYYNTMTKKPYTVSLGAMKNMVAFAKIIEEMWAKNRADINEFFYKKCICYALIFRNADALIYKLPWYEKGGYKANIVTFSLAKIIDSIPFGYDLNYDMIWRQQDISNAFRHEIDIVGKKTQDFLLDPPNRMIITEYAKKEETWNKYKQVPHKLSYDFLDELLSIEDNKSRERIAKKSALVSTQVSEEIEIVNLGVKFWESFLYEAEKYPEFTPWDRMMLKVAIGMNKKIPTPKQAKEIMKIKNKFEELGVVIVKN